MSRVFDGKTLDQFRAEQRELEHKAFEEKAQRVKEDRAREISEAAPPLPLHLQMQRETARLTAQLSELQPGDPRAVAIMRASFLSLLEIVGYVLEITGGEDGKEPAA